jgi:hypothetical protein
VVGVGVLAVSLLLFALGMWLTVQVVSRTWKRRRTTPALARIVVLFVALAAAFGVFGTVVGLYEGFTAVGGEDIEPSQKARRLAEGISEAMNCGALAILVWVPSIVLALVLTREPKNGAPR